MADLEAFIERVEALGRLNERVAAEATPAVADVVRRNVSQNVAPDGEAWPAKKGGGKALEGASGALKASAKGNKIVLQVGEPYVFHNWGAGGSSTTKQAERARKRTRAKQAKTGVSSKFHAPRRQILPEEGAPIPTQMKDAIGEVAKKVFDQTMRGR